MKRLLNTLTALGWWLEGAETCWGGAVSLDPVTKVADRRNFMPGEPGSLLL